MERLDVNIIKAMTPQAWYGFLLDKYFRWKFTAPNRYASTTKTSKATKRTACCKPYIVTWHLGVALVSAVAARRHLHD